jgi:hypothetical protein
MHCDGPRPHISSLCAQGLLPETVTHFAGLIVDGKRVGIDMRGKGTGSCLVMLPTAFEKENGLVAAYEWFGTYSYLPLVDDLPAMPPWLCELLNGQALAKRSVVKRSDGQGSGMPKDGGGGGMGAGGVQSKGLTPDLHSVELQADVVSALKSMLAQWGDHSSRFSEAVESSVEPGCVMYNFRNGPDGRDSCPYFPASMGTHDSNNFGLLRRGTEIFYVCHGVRCKVEGQQAMIRLGVGRLPFPVAAAFRDSQALNFDRNHLYHDRVLFPVAFLRKNLHISKGK